VSTMNLEPENIQSIIERHEREIAEIREELQRLMQVHTTTELRAEPNTRIAHDEADLIAQQAQDRVVDDEIEPVAEFEAIFSDLGLMSKASPAVPLSIKASTHHQQFDMAMRSLVLDPMSAAVKYIRRALLDYDVEVSKEAVAYWFQTQLTTAVPSLSSLSPVKERSPSTNETPRLPNPPKVNSSPCTPPQSSVIRWPELFAAKLLKVGDLLIIKTSEGEVRARLVDEEGQVTFDGKIVSASMWGREVKGWDTINIYQHVFVEIDGAMVPVQELRTQALSRSRFS
jgi:hypothetical protein